MRYTKVMNICNRCKKEINYHWYKRIDLTRFREKCIIGGYVHKKDFDLCGSCTEKFERFMDMQIDDEKPTEYEEYHSIK